MGEREKAWEQREGTGEEAQQRTVEEQVGAEQDRSQQMGQEQQAPGQEQARMRRGERRGRDASDPWEDEDEA